MFSLKQTIMLCAATTMLTCATLANASPEDAAPTAQWSHHHGIQHDLEQIHAQLKLTAAQEQLWQTAATTMETTHQQTHAARQQSQQQIRVLMQEPTLDLHAIQAAREQAETKVQQLHARAQEAWLKLYDSLDARQKMLVSTVLKAKWQKMETRHAKMSEHWKMHSEPPAAPE